MEKNIWFSSKQLMERWGINQPTLAQYVVDNRLPCRRLRKFNDLRDSVIHNTLDNIIRDFDLFVFSIQDILEFEKTQGPIVETNKWGEYYFVLNGDFWEIGFGNEKGYFKKIDGLGYIAQLISSPGKENNTRDLYEGIKCTILTGDRKQREEYEKPGRLEQENLSAQMSYQPSSYISEKDMKEFKEIERDMEDPDPVISQEARTRREEYLKKFLKEKSIQVPEISRVRINVLKRIDLAIKRIKINGLPKLSDHLKKHIKTGTECVYFCDPETMPKWFVKN